ncbi:hypothetical protein [Granulicella sp. dw_53]|uniref:hypothetical protein n=1 Tax=Granulicella sp. dw_53 TaxID=2719792 RepID=UPI001BD1BE76|nr:hypothetical protein [Granulicella sp. dw_53]
MGKGAAFLDINRRHGVMESLFSERDFRARTGLTIPIGLCAGLVQTWWREVQKGNDGIECLRRSSAALARDVVIAQVLNVYLKRVPETQEVLNFSEAALMRCKYGETIAGLRTLQRRCMVDNLLELDLVLHFGMPLTSRWELPNCVTNVTELIMTQKEPGLFVLIMRFSDPSRASGERGHRTALSVEDTGVCRFYDPWWGEVRFCSVNHFASWFMDYWTTQKWGYVLGRGKILSPPIQVYWLSGMLSLDAAELRKAQERRRAEMTYRKADFDLWLSAPVVVSLMKVIERAEKHHKYKEA